MLVLSRKRDQALVIGDQYGVDQIRVTVLKMQGDSVRLGIEAPPHISIHRDEVHERIAAEMRGERPGHADRPAEDRPGKTNARHPSKDAA